MKRIIPFLLSTVIAVTAIPSAAFAARGHEPRRSRCTDRVDRAKPLNLEVDGEMAHGAYALPAREPAGLVVFAHGYGHTSVSWKRHMRRVADDLGVVAVAMDYRGAEISPDSNGDGLPEARGWNVTTGAEDSIAAALMFEDRCRSIDKVVLMGVSMGGNTSGLALAETGAAGITDPSGGPLFDYWIDVEGAVNVTETYFEARTLAPANSFAAAAQADIEAEAGGPYESNPGAYEHMTVMRRLDDIAASGVEGAVVIHGLDDGLVPYNQGREMAFGLAASDIPLDMFTIGRKSPESEAETTASGYVGGQIDPDYRSPLAGHASEKSETHIVMVTAFERLAAIFSGETPGPFGDYFVDGEAGTFP